MDQPDRTPPDEPVIEQDLGLILGGGFNLDAIGPALHEEVLARIREHPDAYVRAFEERYLGGRFDPQLHARIHATAFVAALQQAGAAAARAVGDELIRHYDGALLIYDDVQDRARLDEVVPTRTVDALVRLDDRRRWLRAAVAEG